MWIRQCLVKVQNALNCSTLLCCSACSAIGFQLYFYCNYQLCFSAAFFNCISQLCFSAVFAAPCCAAQLAVQWHASLRTMATKGPPWLLSHQENIHCPLQRLTNALARPKALWRAIQCDLLQLMRRRGLFCLIITFILMLSLHRSSRAGGNAFFSHQCIIGAPPNKMHLCAAAAA